MTESDFYATDWFDLDWSEWKPLDAGSSSVVPKEPRLYRIRYRNEERNHLEYIGESGDTRRRIQSLARGVYAQEMPYRDPHTAAPCLWAIRDNVDSALEVSHTTPSKAEDEQHRKGIEAALIALHRRKTARSPTANFGRIIDGYKPPTALTTLHTGVVVSHRARRNQILQAVSSLPTGRTGVSHWPETG